MKLARVALHVSRTLVHVGATAVVFAVALVAGVLLHLGTSPSRRIVARELPLLLDDVFPGHLRVRSLGGLSLRGVGGVDVDLVHPDGADVAHLRGVQATLDPVRAVKALLGAGPIEIPIRSVSVDSLDIDLSTHDGTLRLADVFVDPDEPATPDDPGARPIELSIREIAVRHAWAHGRIDTGPIVDADLDDLLATFALDDETVRVGLTHVDIATRGAPRGADVRGRLSAAFDATSEPAADRPARSAFYFLNGTVARSPISSLGLLRGDALHAWVFLPDVEPGALREVVPEAPSIASAASATAVVDGTLDHLVSRVLVAAGKSRLDVRADAVLVPSLVATATVRATDLDASLLGGPASAVSLDADAHVEMLDAGDLRAQGRVTTSPGVVAGIPIPGLDADATFAGETAHAVVEVHEPGMRATLSADLRPGPRGPVIDASVSVPRADLAALERRGIVATGVVEVDGRARLDLGAETLDASLRVVASGLSANAAPGVRVESLRVDARARGAPTSPDVHATAQAAGVAVAGRHLRGARVSVDGPAMHPVVTADVSSNDLPDIRARARVDVRRGPAFEDVRVDARRGTTTAKLTVERLALGGRIPAVREARLDGLGETLELSVTPERRGATRIVAKAPRISVPAVSELVGLDAGVREGRLGFDADVVLGPSRVDGVVRVDVQDVDVGRPDTTLSGVDGSVSAEIRGREVRFSLDAESTAIGHLHVRSTRTVELAGPPTALASWRDAAGALRIDGDLRLAAIAKVLPPETLPVTDVEGRIVVTGDVAREAMAAPPSLDLEIHTDGLALVGKPARTVHDAAKVDVVASHVPHLRDLRDVGDGVGEATTATGARPSAKVREVVDPTPVAAWTLRGVDVVAHARATPAPPKIELAASARDAHGELVAVSASSDIDYGNLARGERFDLGRLERAPLSAKLSIPSRKIDDLPPLLGIPRTKGRVVLEAALEGTLERPTLAVDGALVQLSIEGSPLEAPFAVKVKADYDGAQAHAHVALDQGDARLFQATGSAAVALRDVLHPRKDTPLPWTGSADVDMGPLPLDVLEAVLPTKIDGIARGHIALRDLHRDGSLDADVSIDGLVLGGIPHREASVRVLARDGELVGKLKMAQSDGSLEAEANVGLAWGSRVVPELRPAEVFDVGVRASRFRLRAAEPFLASVVNRLDGRLDGDVRLSKEALTDAAKGRGVKGELALSRGSLEIAAGGGPLDDVRAKLRVDDRGMVWLDDVFARGTTGELRAVGVASFGQAGFQAARLHVVIPKDKPMPLLVSGEHLADVSANVKVAADMVDRGRELRVGIDIPRLQVELPDSLPDGVQPLDDIEHVRIGTMRHGRFIPLAVDAPDPVAEPSTSSFRTRLDIDLRNARIVKGDMLSTWVRGRPSLLIDGARTEMSGDLKLAGGRVDIKGRRFEIESGTITFTGDPTNPDVLLTAKWKAPDDTWIYADFAGPLATGKVTLRSDPPRSREEILALVLFGRVEGYSSGGQQADEATQAVGMAGGFATEGLNEVLDDVTDVEIRTRVDTSSSANPRPELEVQISREIAARIAYVLGELAPGQSPDRTYATLDWSFRPEWSLETTVGDKQSTTVDMIWERRY